MFFPADLNKKNSLYSKSKLLEVNQNITSYWCCLFGDDAAMMFMFFPLQDVPPKKYNLRLEK